LPPGEYELRVSECASAPAGAGFTPSTALWPGLPARVTLSAGQVRTLPPALLLSASGLAPALRLTGGANRASTGGIAGRVTGKGHPLQGICADAFRVGGGGGRGAATPKTGRYRISGLEPGRYQVQFTTGCGSTGNWLSQWYLGITTPFDSPKATVIRVRAGKTKTGIDASLKLGGQIGGTVRSRSGAALPGICVTIFGRVRGGFVGYEVRSGRGGHYVLHSVFPGRYAVQFSIGCGNKGNYAPQWWRLKSSAGQATPIKITGPRVVSHIDAALSPGALISGTVRAVNSTGKPLAGVCVEASDRRGDDFADALTAKDGSYQLKGLAGGRYLIVFDPTCFGSTSSNFLGQHRVVSVKPAGSRTGVNDFLQPGRESPAS